MPLGKLSYPSWLINIGVIGPYVVEGYLTYNMS